MTQAVSLGEYNRAQAGSASRRGAYATEAQAEITFCEIKPLSVLFSINSVWTAEPKK